MVEPVVDEVRKYRKKSSRVFLGGSWYLTCYSENGETEKEWQRAAVVANNTAR